MKEIWPIIAVSNVVESSKWYMKLLDAQGTHPDAKVFNQIVGESQDVLLCLHHWGPSGPKGDHVWPSLMEEGAGNSGHGLLLWFVIDDLEKAWQRAQALDAMIASSIAAFD